MPYICLARDLPDGVVQVLDLSPNASQRTVYDPPAQTRYVNRVDNETAALTNTGVLQNSSSTGLQAYLLDQVEPGGLEQAGATVTFAGVQVGDRLTLKGIIFEAQAGANPANWNAPAAGTDANPFLFGIGANNNATAANFALMLLDAGDVLAAIDAVAPIGVHVTALNTGAPSAVIDFLADDGAAVIGPTGDLSLVVSNAVRMVVTSAVAASAQRLTRDNGNWNTGLSATADAIIAQLDGGLAMTLGDVDAILLATCGGELTSAAGSNSTGVLTDLLSVLAGRGYRVNHATDGVVNQYMTATGGVPNIWNGGLGGFTEDVLVNGTVMNSGEIRPVTIGGDVQAREIKGITHTYEGGSFRLSVASGVLGTMMAAAGKPGITLYPDSDLEPFFPWQNQGALTFPTVQSARLVTVYDDDGSLITP